MIEGDDAPGLGGRDGQAAADVVERAAADPPDSILDGMQRRQEQVAPILRLLQSRPAKRASHAPRFARPRPILTRAARAADRRPRAPRCSAQPPTMCRSTGSVGHSLSIATAAALNSAVPDFGSVASIVSRLVATSSGK